MIVYMLRNAKGNYYHASRGSYSRVFGPQDKASVWTTIQGVAAAKGRAGGEIIKFKLTELNDGES